MKKEHEEVDGVRANSLSFYPILKSECLAPLTLETGCGGRDPTHHHTTAIPWLPPPRPFSYPLSSSFVISLLCFFPFSLSLSLSLTRARALSLSLSLSRSSYLPDCLPCSLQPYSIHLLDIPLPTFQPSPSTYVGCRVRGESRHEILDKTAFWDFLL